MKNKIVKAFLKGMAALVCAVTLAAMNPLQAYAYNYATPSAYEAGAVTIQEVAGGNTVNGYSTSGGYRVTYTIERSDWIGFDEMTVGYFLTGNQLSTSNGCHFGYHHSGGEIWEDGAVALGYLSDGVQVAQSNVSGGKVSYSFTVSSLDQLPTYIAYAYAPIPSAYLHLTEEKGTKGHIWYYANLKNKSVQAGSNIDKEAPSLSVSVVPKGTVANVGGKVWSTAADITVTATDNQSRPEGVRIYRGSSLIKEIKNANNAASLQGGYEVTQNGSYQVDTYDKLNNTSNKNTVSVSCIDREAPVISSLTPNTTAYAREVTLKAGASDGGSGLHEKAYSWNGGAFSEEAELKVTQNGTYTLKVRDALGNESSKSIIVSNIDRNAPEISHKVTLTGNQTTYQGVLWSTGAKFSAEAVDKESGTALLKILGEDQELIEEVKDETGKEMLSMEDIAVGKGTYCFFAQDKLGNSTQTEWISLAHVDSEAPVIDGVDTEKMQDGSVKISVLAEDAPGGIGLEDKAYSFDGGETWQEDNTYIAKENGAYEIIVRDRLGQESTQTCQVTQVTPKDDKTDDGNNDDSGNHSGKDHDPGNNGGANNNGTQGGNDDHAGGGNNSSQEAGKSPVTSSVTRSASSASKKLKEKQTAVKDSLSGNISPFTYVEKKEASADDALAEAKEQEVEEIVPSHDPEPEQSPKSDPAKTVAAVLGVLFALGSLGAVLYLLLFYLQHSCIFYELDDARERKRLCRLLIGREDGNWQVKVPDDKLGLNGTGKYLLSFHPAFLKEDEPDAVIIEIDGRTLREKPAQEITISI
ncbi:MAG: hypothetical protein J1E61_00870 [Lachnospiraceae bacterium]|nr:hypothetical protein [Lachnospiraceae bacterium]